MASLACTYRCKVKAAVAWPKLACTVFKSSPFTNASVAYENEQTELKAEVKKLQEEIIVQEQKIQNLEVFIQRVKKYTTLKELTPYALRELVKGIYVEAPDKSSGKRKQKAHIEYDLVGFIPVDELMKAEKV